MRLAELLTGVALLGQQAPELPEVTVTSLSYDTRTLESGALYFALSGYKTDGHNFIGEALRKGAVLVICERAPEAGVPHLLVENARAALAEVSANFFGHPGDGMTLLAVTGTNGKTTTTYLLKNVLETVLGTKVGLVGTNQNMMGEEVLPAHRTTPESYELQALLRRMADAGCTHVVMEASSHALALSRVRTLHFKAGVFTNLTQDHLDFHGTMEAYKAAKGLLFAQSDIAVLNLDDQAGREFLESVSCPVFSYSENKNNANLTAKNIRLLPMSVEFEAVSETDLCRVTVPIPGCFSIYNALACVACCLTLGMELSDIAAALRKAQGVKGRAEVVPVPAEFTVLIDYAHSPDALENILNAVRGFTKGRVIVLFGCGGDRDRSKRPVMGAIAAQLADVCVITSDNPRTEDPAGIIGEILAGLPKKGVSKRVEPDRRRAIRLALSLAKPGDTVLLAGKGHETYQETAGTWSHMDEREEIIAYFAG